MLSHLRPHLRNRCGIVVHIHASIHAVWRYCMASASTPPTRQQPRPGTAGPRSPTCRHDMGYQGCTFLRSCDFGSAYPRRRSWSTSSKRSTPRTAAAYRAPFQCGCCPRHQGSPASDILEGKPDFFAGWPHHRMSCTRSRRTTGQAWRQQFRLHMAIFPCEPRPKGTYHRSRQRMWTCGGVHLHAHKLNCTRSSSSTYSTRQARGQQGSCFARCLWHLKSSFQVDRRPCTPVCGSACPGSAQRSRRMPPTAPTAPTNEGLLARMSLSRSCSCLVSILLGRWRYRCCRWAHSHPRRHVFEDSF